MDAVKKLNEVKGIRGLERYFKQVRIYHNFGSHDTSKNFIFQVAQSARFGDGGQDDFLGSIDIPIRDIPVQGMDRWYKLEGKSVRRL